MTDAVIEAMARAMCKCNGTAQCAAICLSYSATTTRNGKCPEAVRVHGRDARAAYLAGQKAMREAVAAEVREECAKVADAVAENMRSLCAHYRKGGMPQFATESLLQQRTAEAIAATIRAG